MAPHGQTAARAAGWVAKEVGGDGSQEEDGPPLRADWIPGNEVWVTERQNRHFSP